MTVEAASYINALNKLWPLGSDQKLEGDDHIRLVKAVLQSQFVNFGVAAIGIGMRLTPDRIVLNTARDLSGTDFMEFRQDGSVVGLLKSFNDIFATTSGTYVKSANLKFLEIELLGGGGGGGASPGTTAGQMAVAGGGGAGGRGIAVLSAGSVPASLAYTIGAAGGSNGSGGNSSYGSYVAIGGNPGQASVAGAGSTAGIGGTGGSASLAPVQAIGDSGSYGWCNFNSVGLIVRGRGGSTPYGSGGGGAIGAGTLAGGDASGWGAGGGGGGTGQSSTAQNGGAGTKGFIRFREWF